ncbi:AIR synthase family protein [soil metagenome]
MHRTDPLIAGKLPGPLLQRLLARFVRTDPSVLIGPEVGADAAAIEIQGSVVILKTDPITFPTPDIARYLVNVNANDVVCMGGTPRWLLVTTLLPDEGPTVEEVEELFRQLAGVCGELNIALVGGHTEITESVNRPIMVGMMVGEATRESLLDLRRSRHGDKLLLCNTVAVEGTAILASEAPPELLTGIPQPLLDRARRLTNDPGISVVAAAQALVRSDATIRGLHDPTEGGIATAIWEIASVNGCDIELSTDIPIREETVAICDALGLDPLGLIASGALLAVVSSESSSSAIDHLQSEGVEVAEIGRLLVRSESNPHVRNSDRSELPTFKTDEIARFFAEL